MPNCDLKNKKILLTGATGFIGGHLSRLLLSKGVSVFCVARSPRKIDVGQARSLRLHIIEGDLSRDSTLARFPQEVDAVIHLAATLGHWGCDRGRMLKSNVGVTHRLLDWFCRSASRHFVFVSTPGVQGFGHKSAAEGMTYNPRGIYEESKVLAEQRVLNHSFGDRQHWTIARPDFVYGPGDLRRIPLYRRIKKRQWIKVGDGQAMMRPTCVDDVCKALALCAANPKAYSQIFNIAGPEPVSADKYVDTIAQAAGVRPSPLRIPSACFMATASVLEWVARRTGSQPLFTRSQVEFFTRDHATDITRIRECLGFRPQTFLIDGLRETMRWARDQKLL